MKNMMKKQSKRFPLWGHRGMLTMALSSLAVAAHAQGVDVCAGTPYTITSTVDASGASTYQWLENGAIISSAKAATYVVPTNKATGLYTYIRQAKSEECNEWQSSNEFVVTVFNCSFSAGTETGATTTFTDPRDGKTYKTVVMPDGKSWFAQNLNYTKDLTYNAYSYEANGKPMTAWGISYPAIGSYWCPPSLDSTVTSGAEIDCRLYGACYTWESAMMVDGKYADENKTSSEWNESWVSGNYNAIDNVAADRNVARGGTSIKGGGRGICPKGWHVPTDMEWLNLERAVDQTITTPARGIYGTDCANKLKSKAVSMEPKQGYWLTNLDTHTDNWSFNSSPVAYRSMTGDQFRDPFVKVTYQTSSPVASEYVWQHIHAANIAGAARWPNPRSVGVAVRCINDY